MEFDDTVNWDYYKRLDLRRRQIACYEHVRPLLRMMTEIKSLYATREITVVGGQITSVESTLPPGAQGQYDALADVVAQIRSQYEQ